MIFVTGCARSGTSLTTKILKAHGCCLGQSDRINELYENVGVRQNVLKPYLRSLGADPQGQRELPDTSEVVAPRGFKDDVLKYILGNEPRAYKDAKLTLVWPAFADAFPDAVWVLVRRNAERIVDSCLRTPFMRAYNDRDGWMRWVEEHERRFDLMKAALDLVEVWPDEVIDDPSSFAPIAEFCGLRFDLDATEAAIDRDVWHHN